MVDQFIKERKGEKWSVSLSSCVFNLSFSFKIQQKHKKVSHHSSVSRCQCAHQDNYTNTIQQYWCMYRFCDMAQLWIDIHLCLCNGFHFLWTHDCMNMNNLHQNLCTWLYRHMDSIDTHLCCYKWFRCLCNHAYRCKHTSRGCSYMLHSCDNHAHQCIHSDLKVDVDEHELQTQWYF